MSRIKKLWTAYGGRFLLCLPMAIIALCIAVKTAKPRLRTITKIGR